MKRKKGERKRKKEVMKEGVFWIFREVVFRKVRLYLAIMGI